MSDMFLYTVKPRKTIVGLSGSAKVVRTNKSLYLTKEDVLICLKNASVYRRFANEGINERVTIDNVDRVHRENYIAEADWAAFCAQEKSKDHGTVKVPGAGYGEKKDEIVAPVDEIVGSTDDIDKEESEQTEEVSENVTENKIEDTLPVNESIEAASEEVVEDTTEISQDVEDDTAVESDDDEEVEKAE